MVTVKVGENLYQMQRRSWAKLAEEAAQLVECGVYAIEKDGYCELRNDTMSREETQAAIEEWTADGWTCYARIQPE